METMIYHLETGGFFSMKNTKPIYTIGHRNPDTDSICSAIGYAHLKQAMGENVVPARAGKVNEETKFALNHFRVEQPLLITDLYPRVKDITAKLSSRRRTVCAISARSCVKMT